jgi:hypothetical protein
VILYEKDAIFFFLSTSGDVSERRQRVADPRPPTQNLTHAFNTTFRLLDADIHPFT